jgi:hypothetical protein
MVRWDDDKGGREKPCQQVRTAESRPDFAISAAKEIAQRKNKSFAQYTGALGFVCPISWGRKPEFSLQIRWTGPFK